MSGRNRPLRVLAVLGTRPEAVKLFPVIRALEQDGRLEVLVAVTGQHREMLDQILGPFGIRPHADLEIMQPGQSLTDIASRVLPRIDSFFGETSPALVMVQGDTTSAFCAALAAFHRRIPVAHVEAGLRSHDRFHPYPEEANRRMIGAVADMHLAPTAWSAENLLREGVPRGAITITGNTAVDSLLETLRDPRAISRQREAALDLGPDGDGRMVLITVHRRESWDAGVRGGKTKPLEEIFEAIRASAAEHPTVDFVYPVHRNPGVSEPAHRILGGLRNVRLLDPVPYIPFVGLMSHATAILTDSGGIQEEAPSLGIPTFVLRETTERPEGLDCGTNRLLGTSRQAIEESLREALARPPGAPRAIPLPNPFGDGKAAARIHGAVLHFLGLGERPDEFGARGEQPPGRSLSTGPCDTKGRS